MLIFLSKEIFSKNHKFSVKIHIFGKKDEFERGFLGVLGWHHSHLKEHNLLYSKTLLVEYGNVWNLRKSRKTDIDLVLGRNWIFFNFFEIDLYGSSAVTWGHLRSLEVIRGHLEAFQNVLKYDFWFLNRLIFEFRTIFKWPLMASSDLKWPLSILSK